MSDPASASVPRSGGGTVGQRGRNGGFVPTADDLQGDLLAGLVGADAGGQLAVVGDRLAVDADHQVAGAEPGLGGRAARGDVLDEGAVLPAGGLGHGHAEVADLDLLALD